MDRDRVRSDEDYDAEVEEQLEDEDEEAVAILSKLSELIHEILKAYKIQAMPLFETVLPMVVKLLVRVTLKF